MKNKASKKKKVHPAAILAAAKIAEKDIAWRFGPGDVVVSDNPGYGLFDPLGEESFGPNGDAWILEEALEKMEWIFQYETETGLFKATNIMFGTVKDRNRNMRGIKCVAAMKEIEVYL